jgi:hypothetical protein
VSFLQQLSHKNNKCYRTEEISISVYRVEWGRKYMRMAGSLGADSGGEREEVIGFIGTILPGSVRQEKGEKCWERLRKGREKKERGRGEILPWEKGCMTWRRKERRMARKERGEKGGGRERREGGERRERRKEGGEKGGRGERRAGRNEGAEKGGRGERKKRGMHDLEKNEKEE